MIRNMVLMSLVLVVPTGKAFAFGGGREVVEDVIQFGQEAGAFYHDLTNYHYGNTHIRINPDPRSPSVTIRYTFRRAPQRVIVKDRATKKTLSVKLIPAETLALDSTEQALSNPKVSPTAKREIKTRIASLNRIISEMKRLGDDLENQVKAKKLSRTEANSRFKQAFEKRVRDAAKDVPGVRIES
jgi:hypothetical protein